MIVCSCHGVPCRRIRQEIREGARTIRDVARRCRAGAGAGCGACRQQIAGMIASEVGAERAVDGACAAVGVGDKAAAA